MNFVANFIRFSFQQCKNFENRLRFDKVTESSKVGTFFETQCRCGHRGRLPPEPTYLITLRYIVADFA